MRILVIGANGQVGSELRRVLAHEHLILGTRPLFDVTNVSIEEKIVACRPQVVIHAAAFTKVDESETNPDLAMRVNAEGTRFVAKGAARAKARLLYLSTDYVFDGRKAEPYTEQDPVNPVNMYGRSKLQGEEEALAACQDTLIVRTSWVYGPHGQNFVKTILKLSSERPELRIVDDQRGSPTYAYDLAVVMAGLIEKRITGIIHAGGEGMCSWYELARTAIDFTNSACRLIPIATSESGRPAVRPLYSPLSVSRLHFHGLALPPWRDGLRRFLAGSRATRETRALDLEMPVSRSTA